MNLIASILGYGSLMQEVIMLAAGGICLICLVLMIVNIARVGKLKKKAKAARAAQAREEAERRAQEEAEAQAREEAARKAQEEAEAQARAEAERKAQEEAEAQAKAEAERKAREEAEAQKQAEEEAKKAALAEEQAKKSADDEYLRKMEELTLRNEEAARRMEEAARQQNTVVVAAPVVAPVVEEKKEEVVENPDQVDIKFVKVEFEESEPATEEPVAEVAAAENDEFSFVKEKTQSVSVSLAAKIALSSTDVKSYFCEIINYALSFKKVKRRTSWSAEKLYSGRIPLLTLKMNGKTLGAYFALNPSDYEGTTLPYKDVSDKKSYVETPLMLKIKSGLSLKRAKALIDDVMNNNSIEKGEPVVAVTPADYPAADVATFAEQGEIGEGDDE